jgi:8-oxo-dGTP pyrophosphatase MutT (NUDIX family)
VFECIDFEVETGVSALPVNHTGELLLIKHFQLGIRQDGISLPTGGLNRGEDPETRMQLELQEEAGLKAGRLTLMARSHPLPSYISTIPGYIFLAQKLTPSKIKGDEPYDISLLNVSPAQALSMIQSGEITDSRAALAILLYHTFYMSESA